MLHYGAILLYLHAYCYISLLDRFFMFLCPYYVHSYIEKSCLSATLLNFKDIYPKYVVTLPKFPLKKSEI